MGKQYDEIICLVEKAIKAMNRQTSKQEYLNKQAPRTHNERLWLFY